MCFKIIILRENSRANEFLLQNRDKIKKILRPTATDVV